MAAGESFTTQGPVTTVIPPTTSELPENCTFESGVCQWIDENDASPIWALQTGTNSDGTSIGLGPSFDHTTGGDSKLHIEIIV